MKFSFHYMTGNRLEQKQKQHLDKHSTDVQFYPIWSIFVSISEKIEKRNRFGSFFDRFGLKFVLILLLLELDGLFSIG